MDKVQVALAKVGHDTDNHKSTNEAYNNNASCCKYGRAKSPTKEVEMEKMAPMK